MKKPILLDKLQIRGLLLMMLLLTSYSLLAQDRTVRGVVRGGSDEGLPGVNILLKGTSQGTTTNANGEFSVTIPSTVTDPQLVVSFIGYETKEIAIGNQNYVDVVLPVDSRLLNEVVVVGYGAVRKSDLTGAISTVKTEDMKSMAISSLEQGLQGRATGIQVVQSSSAPGGGISVRIRGGNSINGGNEPLYVIDGFPVYNNNDEASPSGGKLGGFRTAPNALASLNPNDIASIEVLKDASATAIYGARGANGVVLITTKRGNAGQSKITFDLYTGIQKVDRTIDVLNGREFTQLADEYARNLGLPAYYSADQIAKFNTNVDWKNLVGGTGTNWQDQILQTAPISNYQISLSGGSEKTRYLISGNYFTQDGIIKRSGFQRYSLRTNLDTQVSDRLSVGTSISISRTLNNQTTDGGMGNANSGAIHAAMQYLPLLPIRLNNGLYSRREDEPSPLNPFGRLNPVQLVESVSDLTTTNRILGNVFGEYKLLDNLRLRVALGTDLDSRERNYYFLGDGERDVNQQGVATIGTTSALSWINTNMLTYDKSFGDHNLTVTGVYELQARTFQARSLGNSIFVTDAFGVENIGAGTQTGGASVSSSKNKWSLASYLARINYGYKGRYLATVSARADGSSRFGRDSKWGFFPSLALAWRVSEEPFLRESNLVSDLKLRGSIGQIGNQEIGPYRSLTRINNVDYTLNRQKVTGLIPTELGNPGLKWETTTQADLGVDLGLFNNRLSVTFDAYYKKTTDLLFNISLPYNSGYSSTQGNVGNIENKGVELALGGVVVDGPLKWRSDFNISANRSKVLALSTVGKVFGSTLTFDYRWRGNMLEVGQPVGVFYGYPTDGIYKSTEEITNSAQPNAKPGDVRYVDTNKDGKVDASDRTILGNPAPKFYYGWTNSLEYKGFDLYFLFQGQYGNSVLNATLRDLYNNGPFHNVHRKALYNAWSETNPEGTFPKLGGAGYLSTPTGDEYVDVFVENGSFLRLRNIRLGYTIPFRTAGVARRAHLYVAGQNLLTFTKYSGFNPEVNDRGQNSINQGIDFGAYPLAKTYMLGVSVEF